MVLFLDLGLCAFAVLFAYSLRIDEWRVFTAPALALVATSCALWVAIAPAQGVYRSLLRFSGTHSIKDLAKSCALLAGLLAVLLVAFRFPDKVPRTLSVLAPLVFFFMLASSRLVLSSLLRETLYSRSRKGRRQVLVYGAGVAGQELSLSLKDDPEFQICGFIDDNPVLKGRRLEGCRIWHASELAHVLKTCAVDEVLLALPTASRTRRRQIVEEIRELAPGVGVRSLPNLAEIASGRVSVSDLREIQIEELLGRDQVEPDPKLMTANIRGQSVMVTGAGGSIGSELCRQIVLQQPERIILAERSELALYLIDGELRELCDRHKLRTAIETRLVDVSDRGDVERVYKHYRPETVFHAAAYKHVPLVEADPIAGIRNNVLATHYCCLLGEEYGVRNFTLVSTDKAVRPSSVMGASKRVCELIGQARAAAQTATTYSAVRFGNVLGSSGSVVPLFRRQIAGGGPVTVTQRDATRYFMTVSEAAQLVVQAGAMARGGEIFLLDMGEPVRIGDLAAMMIQLSGLAVVGRERQRRRYRDRRSRPSPGREAPRGIADRQPSGADLPSAHRPGLGGRGGEHQVRAAAGAAAGLDGAARRAERAGGHGSADRLRARHCRDRGRRGSPGAKQSAGRGQAGGGHVSASIANRPGARNPGVVPAQPLGTKQHIPAAFQLVLGLYIVLTGDFPTIVQGLAFGLEGGAGSEFAAAMVTSLTRDLLLLVPVLVLVSHPLGVLHPLIFAVVVWPLLVAMPKVIEEFGGWGGVILGIPLDAPFFVGLPARDAATVWTAIAKYNGIQIVALLSTYAGFWMYRGRRDSQRIPPRLPNSYSLRTVLIGLFAISMLTLLVFVYYRGGIGEHLTSLGRGRFRELSGSGPVIVLTDLSLIALYVWIAARPSDIKSPAFLMCLAAVTVGQFVSTGSRGSSLTVPLLVGLIWSLRRQRIPWKIALMALPIMFVLLGLLSAVRTSSWTGSTAGEAWQTTGWAESFEIAQKEIADRRSISAQVPIVERGFAINDGPMFGRTYVAAATAWIPRTIWPGKPRGADSIYAQMFLRESEEGTAIPVSATVEIFWNFGLPGVVLLSIIYGALLRVIYHFYWRRYPNPFVVILYVLFLTTFHFSTRQLVRLEQQLVLLLICYIAVSLLVPKAAQATQRLGVRLAGVPKRA